MPGAREAQDRAMLWLRTFAVSACIASFGCAYASSWRPLRTVPPDAVVLPVKGRLQEGNRCGPNALAILFAAAGAPLDEDTIAKAVQHERLKAALNIDLLLYARSRGFPARFETGSVDHLIETLHGRIPCLLMVRLERRSRWLVAKDRLWHYVVVYGFSRDERVFFAHTGWGARRLTFDEIQRPWAAAGYWMMHLGEPLRSLATSETE